MVSMTTSASPSAPAEPDPVVRPGQLTVLQLSLRNRHPEVDVPQRGRLGLVGLAAGEHAEEGPLGRPARPLPDGRVRRRPVDREAQGAPELLELLLVLHHEAVAELDEVLPADRDLLLARLLGWRERRVVGQRRVAAHPEVVLHPTLGGHAVVVPPHRVEDLAPVHPLEACARRRCGCTRTRDRRGANRSRSAGACRSSTPGRASSCGRTCRCRRRPTEPPTCPRARPDSASPGHSSVGV